MIPFALNHMTLARASLEELLDTAAELGCAGVELRNDLPGGLFDGFDAPRVGDAARQRGLRVLALSQVNDFDSGSDAVVEQARQLINHAVACDAPAICLIPRNDGRIEATHERLRQLESSLLRLQPLLEKQGVKALIEPLGFASSRLRLKAEVVELIDKMQLGHCFSLVHDTFHHHLAGEKQVFAESTGIVHVSGVPKHLDSDRALVDEDRILVEDNDQLDNLAQLQALWDQGYRGPVSVEAFSPLVHALEQPATALAKSLALISRSWQSESV